LLAAVASAIASLPLSAQRGQRGQQPPASPRATSPRDFTGYWVSVVTEDWRWRMVTPAKGDVDSVPLNAEGRRVTNLWDPGRDEAAGEACRAYAAPAIMRIPGRIHVAWDDDVTLRIDAEAGTQTRLLRFAGPERPRDTQRTVTDATWQGQSMAQWEVTGRGGMFAARPPRPGGALKVVTTYIRAGYLRKNGGPFRANAGPPEHLHLLGP